MARVDTNFLIGALSFALAIYISFWLIWSCETPTDCS
jgi:hypothetical protein